MNRSIRNFGEAIGRARGLTAVAVLAIMAAAPAEGAEAAERSRADGEVAQAQESAGDPKTPDADGPPKRPTALSVAPLDHVEYPGDRPAWLERTPVSEHRPGETWPAETWTVVSGPSETAQQSADRLRVLTRAAVASYIKQLTGATDTNFFPVRSDWIDSMLVEERYAGTLTKGGTRMHESAVALRFPPEAQEEILAAWQETQLRGRLMVVASGTAAVVVLLITASGGLNLIARSGRRRQAAASGAALERQLRAI